MDETLGLLKISPSAMSRAIINSTFCKGNLYLAKSGGIFSFFFSLFQIVPIPPPPTLSLGPRPKNPFHEWLRGNCAKNEGQKRCTERVAFGE
ncbi:hypothetical protein CEXT_110541 [Caerostris extrusa]|uniref:Uncharacterized protein n=1 Tax=Caerostris extrusa TaxID=172846 RepID=A0AAV4SQ73_CAEEX|nr:hypothetical protein CEXT_110541 [Caerostris extrusa]